MTGKVARIAVSGLALGLLCSAPSPSGASHDGPRHSQLERRDSWPEFVALWKSKANDFGNRIADIELVEDGGKLWYVGVFHPGSGKQSLYQYDSFTAFLDRFNKLHKQGMKLVDFDRATVGGKTLYTGVWHQSGQGQYLYCYDSWGEFADKWKALAKKNYRLHDVDVEYTLSVSGNYKPNRPLKLSQAFCGVWKPGTGGYYLKKTAWPELARLWRDLAKKGILLRDVAMNVSGGRLEYTGAWVAAPGGTALYGASGYGSIHDKWGELDRQGYRLIDIEAVRINNTTHYTGVWDR